MTTSPDRKVSNMTGDEALPRKNGELVFEAPWEGRAFGLAVAMNEDGLYDWVDFRDRLVEEIAADEARAGDSSYYERWMWALERLAVNRGFMTVAELDVRTAEYVSGERDDDED
jgi:nitrile hydratase accessory protein